MFSEHSPLAEHLKTLERPDGSLSEEDVIRDARNPTSILHEHFEWNNTRAAHQHRLMQARLLIRRIRIEVTYHHLEYSAPKYMRDSRTNAEVPYRDVYRIRTEADTARDTLIAEMYRVRGAVRRAKATAVALHLGDDIEEIDELVTHLCRKIHPTIDDDPPSTTPS